MKKSIATVAAVICFGMSGAALAEDAETMLANKSCKKEAKALCTGLQPGSGQLQSCLTANADKVSDVCKSALAQANGLAAPSGSAQQPAADPQSAPPK
jgi:hypothetical protein